MIDPYLYVVPNPLSSMNAGKMAAHAGHAASAVVSMAYSTACHEHAKLIGMDAFGDYAKLVRDWIGNRGFGTQITLFADPNEFMELSHEHHAILGVSCGEYWNDYFFGSIIDPTYPYIVPSQEIVDLIWSDLHTLPPKAMGDGRFLCYRKELTALWFFGDPGNIVFRKTMQKFKLHP